MKALSTKQLNKAIETVLALAKNDAESEVSHGTEAQLKKLKKNIKIVEPLLIAAPKLLKGLNDLFYLGERMEQESGEDDPTVEEIRQLLKLLNPTKSDNEANGANYPVDKSRKKLDAIAPILKAAPEMKELLNDVLNEWHSHSNNFNKKEPEYLNKIRNLLYSLNQIE